jgi:hypothetical protein
MSIELTKNQKRIVLEYVLGDVGKGLFEDCEEIWEGMTEDEIDENYPDLRDAVDNFMAEVKQKALDNLEN